MPRLDRVLMLVLSGYANNFQIVVENNNSTTTLYYISIQTDIHLYIYIFIDVVFVYTYIIRKIVLYIFF